MSVSVCGGPVSETLTCQLQDIGTGLDCSPLALLDADSRPSLSSATLDSRPTSLPAPDASCSTKPKPTLRHLSFTKCVKLAPLATAFSKLSPSPSRARSARDSLCGRSPISSRLEPILPPKAGGDPGAVSTAEATSLGSGAAAPVSPSRFTTITSIEAVRAPDSPVPLFPSPKLSTESVFGSTQSLASLSETVSGPRSPRRCSIDGVRELKRKDTMKSRRRSAMTYTTKVQPVP